MKRTLKMLVAVMVLASGLRAFADVSSGWVPSGNATVGYRTENINPCTSSESYKDSQVLADFWLNLPVGLALNVAKYAGLNDANFNGPGRGDQEDYILWYLRKLPFVDLKFRLKYVNYSSLYTTDKKDFLAEDIFLSRGTSVGKAELRLEVFHPGTRIEPMVLSVMPSLYHNWKVGGRVTVYDRIGLQWNGDYGAFSKQVVSAQANCGLKYQISSRFTWNVVDLFGVIPVTNVSQGDPRDPHGALAATTALSTGF